MALVESPGLVVRDPEGTHLLAERVVGLDGPRQHRSVGHVELEAALLQQLAGLLGLFFALGGQVDIVPASEPVLEVPRGLAVADKDDFVECRGSAAHFFPF